MAIASTSHGNWPLHCYVQMMKDDPHTPDLVSIPIKRYDIVSSTAMTLPWLTAASNVNDLAVAFSLSFFFFFFFASLVHYDEVRELYMSENMERRSSFGFGQRRGDLGSGLNVLRNDLCI